MDAKLREIRERWAKATPGPWKQEIVGCEISALIKTDTRRIARAIYEIGSEDPEVMDNAIAIANAPTDIAYLLEVAKAAAELNKYIQEIYSMSPKQKEVIDKRNGLAVIRGLYENLNAALEHKEVNGCE